MCWTIYFPKWVINCSPNTVSFITIEPKRVPLLSTGGVFALHALGDEYAVRSHTLTRSVVLKIFLLKASSKEKNNNKIKV